MIYTTSPTIIKRLGVSEHGDAQDGYLLVNMIMTQWCLKTVGCSQLLVPGRCMHSSLGSVAVAQRREAASITRESFNFCNLLCLCVLPRTRSLQNYNTTSSISTIESCSVEQCTCFPGSSELCDFLLQLLANAESSICELMQV